MYKYIIILICIIFILHYLQNFIEIFTGKYPDIKIIENLISEKECDILIKSAKPTLQTSRVFNPDTKKYECYITVNHKGSKKHSFGKVARFDSLTKFTRHMCKNYDKKIPGLIQHPKILNKDDPELTIIKDRRKGADNSGIYIYQYRCGFCGKIITYNDRREKSIHFKDWDFTNPPSPDKKKQNFDKFNEYIKKQRKEEQSINDGRGRSSSAHNFEYVEVSPNVYNKDELYEYDPNDDNW